MAQKVPFLNFKVMKCKIIKEHNLIIERSLDNFKLKAKQFNQLFVIQIGGA